MLGCILTFTGCEFVININSISLDGSNSSSIVSSASSSFENSQQSSSSNEVAMDQKNTAYNQLLSYISSKDITHYSLVNWHKILNLLPKANLLLEEAKTIDDIAEIVNSIKQLINEIDISEDYQFIKQLVENDYYAQYGIELAMADYFGTYDDSYVVNFLSNDRTPYCITIEDVLFHMNIGNQALIWNDGVFYKLVEGYNKRLILKEDLKPIADIYFTFSFR